MRLVWRVVGAMARVRDDYGVNNLDIAKSVPYLTFRGLAGRKKEMMFPFFIRFSAGAIFLSKCGVARWKS